MEKELIMKILGKKDAVDLDDSIYNLRDIGDDLRQVILLNISVDEEFKTRTARRLKAIMKIIAPISERLKDENYIIGYTNSKKYLAKYIDDINKNINEVIDSMEPFNNKNFIFYTNMLIDLILSY